VPGESAAVAHRTSAGRRAAAGPMLEHLAGARARSAAEQRAKAPSSHKNPHARDAAEQAAAQASPATTRKSDHRRCRDSACMTAATTTRPSPSGAMVLGQSLSPSRSPKGSSSGSSARSSATRFRHQHRGASFEALMVVRPRTRRCLRSSTKFHKQGRNSRIVAAPRRRARVHGRIAARDGLTRLAPRCGDALHTLGAESSRGANHASRAT